MYKSDNSDSLIFPKELQLQVGPYLQHHSSLIEVVGYDSAVKNTFERISLMLREGLLLLF